LLREELDAYGRSTEAVSLSGSEAVLTPKSALALSLALHELATNAGKFGAFLAVSGHVAVTWETLDDGGLGLSWTETGGPIVEPPTRRGFGSSLIERALALETGGRATIHYRPSGIVCDIVLPKSSLVELSIAPVVKSEPLNVDIPSTALPANPRILVVEDSFMVILTIEAMCEDLGWQIVGPATRVDQALALARAEDFDAALLDVNLDGEMSWEVADVLKERGAKKVYAYCTHAVFSGPAIDRIQASELDEVVITDTIPLSEQGKACAKVRQLSVAFLFAETIRRISDGESVTSLFAEQNSNF